ncbi:response regulator transcription factor [candidate division KSB1 bacterium]
MNIEKKKILIVEDEPTLLKMLNEVLSEEGFVVEEAKDGKEGLEKALKTHPDLILLDILMPDMDGIEMAQELRKDEWGKDAKILVLSNLSSMEDVQKALENDIFEYIVKSDVSMDSVINRVKEITG